MSLKIFSFFRAGPLGVIVAILLTGHAVIVHAGNSDLERRLPVTYSDHSVVVALVDSFANPRASAYVVRTNGAAGRDIILIKKANLSPDLLALAARSLITSQRRYGKRPTKPVNIIFFVGQRASASDADLEDWARTTCASLQTAPNLEVGQFGSHPAVAVQIPAMG